MAIDTLIDRFVQQINSSPREGKTDDQVPPALRLDRNAFGWWDWKIERSFGIDWIESLEAKLAIRFPVSFRSLVTRYQFPAFEVGSVMLFANTADGTDQELREQIFRDRLLSEILLRNGFIQFARPESGSYDPVCFDTRQTMNSDEFSIVRMNHEVILCEELIPPVQVISSSFMEFVSQFA